MSDTTHEEGYRDNAHDEHPDDGGVHPHIAPWQMYVGIFAGLVCLTLLTIGVAYIHLGKLNLIVAIVIASMKAALVVTFFMHLKDDNRFNALMFVSSLLFIGVFFAYTMNDTDHRGQLDDAQGVEVYGGTGKEAPGSMPEMEHEDDSHMPRHRAPGGSEVK
ncbi:MAG TPA: cytochrome C oxidase subunit IV family protein [Polyangiaceae bacterium]